MVDRVEIVDRVISVDMVDRATGKRSPLHPSNSGQEVSDTNMDNIKKLTQAKFLDAQASQDEMIVTDGRTD